MTVEARAAAPVSPAGSRWAVLANGDFRLLWLFHFLNFLSFSVEILAIGWLVLEMTDSAFWIGAVAGIRGASQIGFSLISGHLSDRYNRRLVAGVAQVLRGLT